VGLIVTKTEFNPTPRPALRKSVDSSVHPVLDDAETEPKRIGQDAVRFGNASDSVKLSRKDKPVEISITIPKSLRKKLKAAAKNQGITVEELIASRLSE
jgi:hypothetical protein